MLHMLQWQDNEQVRHLHVVMMFYSPCVHDLPPNPICAQKALLSFIRLPFDSMDCIACFHWSALPPALITLRYSS